MRNKHFDVDWSIYEHNSWKYVSCTSLLDVRCPISAKLKIQREYLEKKQIKDNNGEKNVKITSSCTW